jgi:hypothetical protein
MKLVGINLAASGLATGKLPDAPEILAEIALEVRRMSTHVPDGHHLDEIWRIRVVIDSLHQIPKSRNCYLEGDLEVILRDRFLGGPSRGAWDGRG